VRIEPGRSAETDREFTEFYLAHAPGLLRTAWLLTGDAVRAEELVQAVCVRAYSRWSHIRRGDALAYVRRMLVNARIDGWRANRREHLVPAPPERGVPDAALTSVDHRDELRRALLDLSPRQRQVIALRYFHGLSNEEIARDLAISTGTVKSTLSRGLAQLRSTAPFTTAGRER